MSLVRCWQPKNPIPLHLYSINIYNMTPAVRMVMAEAANLPHFPFKKLPRELRDAIYDEVSATDVKPQVMISYSTMKKKGLNSKEAVMLTDRTLYDEYCDARIRTLLACDTVDAICPSFHFYSIMGLLDEYSTVEGRAAQIASKLNAKCIINPIVFTIMMGPEGMTIQLTRFLEYCVKNNVAVSIQFCNASWTNASNNREEVSKILDRIPTELQEMEQWKLLQESKGRFSPNSPYVKRELVRYGTKV